MELHPRELDVERAQAEIHTMVLDKAREAGLTRIELLQALNDIERTSLKYMLRIERHGDPEKPAGLK